MSYTCDTLPLHPPPEPWESLTSYLIRLATYNGIQHISDLITLVFPRSSFRKTQLSTDYPLRSLDCLSRITACSEAQLRATTMYHLAGKFGYIGNAYQLGLFFRESLVCHLRYCPGCLASQPSPFYSLLWRFRLLPGCIEHGSRFLEVCGHCGVSIKLLTPRSRMTICPQCYQDLRRCSLQPMTKREWQSAYAAYTDLTVFLVNVPSHLHTTNFSALSPQTTTVRAYQRRQYIRSTLYYLRKHLPQVRNVQDEGYQRLTFATFCTYADMLDMPIRDLWEHATGERLPRETAAVPDLATYWEHLRRVEGSARERRYSRQDTTGGDQDEVVRRVRAAQNLLESQGQPVTQRSIAVIVQMSVKHLCRYPGVKHLLQAMPW